MKYLRPITAVVGTEEVEIIEWQPQYDPLTLQPIFGASKGFFVVSGPDGPEAMVGQGLFAKPGTKFIVNPDGSILPLTDAEMARLIPVSEPPPEPEISTAEVQPDAEQKAQNQSSKKSKS